jgi:UDP-N-acetylmuramate dehydrogenase
MEHLKITGSHIAGDNRNAFQFFPVPGFEQPDKVYIFAGFNGAPFRFYQHIVKIQFRAVFKYHVDMLSYNKRKMNREKGKKQEDRSGPETIARIIEACLKENPRQGRCGVEVRYNEPMAKHCTFKTGGPADCLIRPFGGGFPAFIAALLGSARAEGIDVFILGGGANILVSDSGVRGIVLDTGGLAGEKERQENTLRFRAGTSLDDAARIAAKEGLSGLEFLAGMPGSIGGAVWMNARCYGQEIAGVLLETEVIDYSLSPPKILSLPVNRQEFGYKISPFQRREFFILSAAFQLSSGNTEEIIARMDANRRDREEKGQYRFPSAGSVFKNNPGFGKPAGKIIDELGLRGLQIGGARIADWHGNFIINTGGAAAKDIRALTEEAAARVKEATGFILEPEILFIGDWGD